MNTFNRVCSGHPKPGAAVPRDESPAGGEYGFIRAPLHTVFALRIMNGKNGSDQRTATIDSFKRAFMYGRPPREWEPSMPISWCDQSMFR